MGGRKKGASGGVDEDQKRIEDKNRKFGIVPFWWCFPVAWDEMDWVWAVWVWNRIGPWCGTSVLSLEVVLNFGLWRSWRSLKAEGEIETKSTRGAELDEEVQQDISRKAKKRKEEKEKGTSAEEVRR